jgi:GNAT superfamily N-acetyltransferase
MATPQMTTTETHPTADRARTPNRVSRVRLARELIRSEGLRSIWPRLLGRVVYRRVVVAAADMDAEYTVPPCSIEMTVRKLEPEDIGAYVALVPNADPSTVARRLDAGSRIYAAWSDRRIISAGWLEVDHALFDAVGARIPIGPKVVYARASYTEPELRGRNIATVGYVSALELLREEGFERAVGFLLPEARSSHGPVVKAGLERVGSLGWFGIGPFRIYFFRRAGEKTRFMPRRRRGGKPVELDIEL